jgi:hypothetical protein
VQHHLGLVTYFRPALAFSQLEAEATLLRSFPVLDSGQVVFARENANVLLFYLFHALPLVCLAFALRRVLAQRERWGGESNAVIAISLMTVVMNIGFLRSPLPARVPDAVVPAVVLLSWSGMDGDDTRAHASVAWPSQRAPSAVAFAVGSAADLSGT